MQASEFVAREVNACRSEDEMDEIGEVYLHLPIAVTMVNHSAVSDGSLVTTRQSGNINMLLEVGRLLLRLPFLSKLKRR